MLVDGSGLLGSYRVSCECGTTWHGRGQSLGNGLYSPALPIAECVVHLRMCHNTDTLNISFTQRFEVWLKDYWEADSINRSSGYAHAADLEG